MVYARFHDIEVTRLVKCLFKQVVSLSRFAAQGEGTDKARALGTHSENLLVQESTASTTNTNEGRLRYLTFAWSRSSSTRRSARTLAVSATMSARVAACVCSSTSRTLSISHDARDAVTMPKRVIPASMRPPAINRP